MEPNPNESADALLDEAILALQAEDAERALVFVLQIKQSGAELRDLEYVHALCCIKFGDLGAAEGALVRELQKYPDNDPVRALLADVRAERGVTANGPAQRFAGLAAGNTSGERRLYQVLAAKGFQSGFVNQFVTTLAFGDGVGNCIRLVRGVLMRWGFESHIFAEGADPRLAGEWNWFLAHQQIAGPGNIIFYHPSDGRSAIIPYLQQIPDRKFLYYHNITPSSFFAPYDAQTAQICETARQAVGALRPVMQGAVCDSNYNSSDLELMGFPPATVLPIPFFKNEFEAQPADPSVLARFSDGVTNILFVGRLAPNKCQHEVVRAFDYYQRNINPRSRLILAGLATGSEVYTAHVERTIAELGTRDVVVTGHINFAELIAYYRTASALLCLSEHEGFCIPLLEAMHYRIPIVAFDGSAVTETLGAGGMFVKTKNPSVIASAIAEALTEPRRSALLAHQDRQLEQFSEDQFRDRLAGFLADALQESVQ